MRLKVFFSGDQKNDHEIKSFFFMRLKVSTIFINFVQEVETLIMRSKVKKILLNNFKAASAIMRLKLIIMLFKDRGSVDRISLDIFT